MFSFGGRQDESDDDDEGEKEKSKVEEKVDPFLPFGPIAEGTNYWNFGAPAAAEQQGAEQSPNSKNAVPLKLANKKKRTPARKAGRPFLSLYLSIFLQSCLIFKYSQVKKPSQPKNFHRFHFPSHLLLLLKKLNLQQRLHPLHHPLLSSHLEALTLLPLFLHLHQA